MLIPGALRVNIVLRERTANSVLIIKLNAKLPAVTSCFAFMEVTHLVLKKLLPKSELIAGLFYPVPLRDSLVPKSLMLYILFDRSLLSQMFQ